jgi:hypothetical protein
MGQQCGKIISDEVALTETDGVSQTQICGKHKPARSGMHTRYGTARVARKSNYFGRTPIYVCRHFVRDGAMAMR